jgi:hypothetical protein
MRRNWRPKGAKEYKMKATNLPLEDDRGFVSVLIQLFHLALTPPTPPGSGRAKAATPGWLERFDRWAAESRRKERERYLAASKDMFELEARIRDLERRPYY